MHPPYITIHVFSVLLLLHGALAQQSERTNYGDGSYCITCSTAGSDPFDLFGGALSCGLQAIFTNGCFDALLNSKVCTTTG